MARFCFLFGFSMGSPETTRKIVLSGRHQKSNPKTSIISKIAKTLDVAFPNILFFFLGGGAVKMRGLETPIFVVFPEGTKMGFNHSPLKCRKWGSIKQCIYICVYIYIYICCGVIIWATFWGF